MSSEAASKVARGPKFPVGAAVAALVLVAGAALAPLARRAWARLAPRGKPPSNEVSMGNGAHANEAGDLGRAENEGMPPGLS
jgi:hypothetical protein